MKKVRKLTMEEICSLHREFSVSASYVGQSKHYSSFDSIHAFGAYQMEMINGAKGLSALQKSLNTDQWHFVCLSYDLKEATEHSLSGNTSRISVPDLFFFVPEYLLIEKNKEWFFIGNKVEDLLEKVGKFEHQTQAIQLEPTISKEDYLNCFEVIQKHIQQGNAYELNYCQEFAQIDVEISPIDLFYSILNHTDAPFSSFLQVDHLSLISASPERFLRRNNNTLISQPIKGTAKRGQNHEEDIRLKSELQQSKKEQAENVMIVDLVRNDLSKICQSGSVSVPHFQTIVSYSTVHQMISSISGELREEVACKEIIEATFPMGSMTGAPKKKVLEIIEEVEEFKRGWYSGALGYIEPNGNFDFNVLIRSFIYDNRQRYLSYGVGSGITTYANGQEEYEECMLKVKSLLHRIT